MNEFFSCFFMVVMLLTFIALMFLLCMLCGLNIVAGLELFYILIHLVDCHVQYKALNLLYR